MSQDPDEAIESHVRAFFAGHEVDVCHAPPDPVNRLERVVPGFRVLRIHPGPVIGLWSFVTIGCWRAVNVEGRGIELVFTAMDGGDRSVEILAMTAFYHASAPEQRLDRGHTVPIGEPWVPGSSLDHLLVTLPYQYGPELERCRWDTCYARLLWLMPISRAERDFKHREGREALERLFEEREIPYADPLRPSVVDC